MKILKLLRENKYILLLPLAVLTERLHKYVFDNIYIQTRKTPLTDREKIMFRIYKILCKKNPNFRQICKDSVKNYEKYS